MRRRCSTACLMALVALAAIDCAAVRSPLSGSPQTVILLLLGGLPMANILAVRLLPLALRLDVGYERRRFLLGFEAAGWAALLIFTFCAKENPDAVRALVVQALIPVRSLGNPAFRLTACAALLLPQLLLALGGGWLNRSFAACLASGDRARGET
jgi:hypothetical protein